MVTIAAMKKAIAAKQQKTLFRPGRIATALDTLANCNAIRLEDVAQDAAMLDEYFLEPSDISPAHIIEARRLHYDKLREIIARGKASGLEISFSGH